LPVPDCHYPISNVPKSLPGSARFRRGARDRSKMERDAKRAASAGSSSQSPPGKPALRALVGLPLAACIVVAALVLQSSYGGGPRWMSPVGRSSLQLHHCRRKTRRFPRSPLQLSFDETPLARRHGCGGTVQGRPNPCCSHHRLGLCPQVTDC